MNCVFPLIKKAIEEGNITVDDIAKSVGEDVVIKGVTVWVQILLKVNFANP